jgi:methionyl aminopeptidase
MSAPVGTLKPGSLTPMRSVPAGIPRPEYVGKKAPMKHSGSDVQSQEIIEKMRIAGRIAALALAEVGANVVPGVTTDELDRIGHEFLLDNKAYPSTLGYRDFTHPRIVKARHRCRAARAPNKRYWASH